LPFSNLISKLLKAFPSRCPLARYILLGFI
jgi:hypothetical protein